MCVCVCVCVYFGREDRHKLMARPRVPPGFRFHPTDEELVAYYLKRKVSGRSIEADVIGVVELYKCEPWDLPGTYVGGEMHACIFDNFSVCFTDGALCDFMTLFQRLFSFLAYGFACGI